MIITIIMITATAVIYVLLLLSLSFSRLAQMVTLCPCISESSLSNLAPNINYPDVFHDFPQSLKPGCRTYV
jgi:hypothetical protein